MKTTIQDQIYRRIRRKGPDTVFVPQDFLDLGGRAAVDQALSRLSRKGVIRRLERGVYDYPKKGRRVKYLSPDVDQVAQKLASKWGGGFSAPEPTQPTRLVCRLRYLPGPFTSPMGRHEP